MIKTLVLVAAISGGWWYLLDKTDKIKSPLVRLLVRLAMLAVTVAGCFE